MKLKLNEPLSKSRFGFCACHYCFFCLFFFTLDLNSLLEEQRSMTFNAFYCHTIIPFPSGLSFFHGHEIERNFCQDFWFYQFTDELPSLDHLLILGFISWLIPHLKGFKGIKWNFKNPLLSSTDIFIFLFINIKMM